MEWMPIESAPKDGTLIDLWVTGTHFTGRISDSKWGLPSDEDGEPVEDEPCWVSLDWHTTYDEWYWMDVEYAPTHWMPLPPPPKTEGE